MGLFDEQLPRLQDWEFWIRISKHYKLSLINEPLTLAYVSSKSISTNDSALIEAEEIILKKHFELFNNASDDILAKIYYILGHHYCLQSDFYNGHLYLKKAIKKHFKPKYLLAYLLSFFGNKFYSLSQKIWNQIKLK